MSPLPRADSRPAYTPSKICLHAAVSIFKEPHNLQRPAQSPVRSSEGGGQPNSLLGCTLARTLKCLHVQKPLKKSFVWRVGP